MTSTTRCLVCGGESVKTDDYLDGHTLLESHELCNDCGYEAEYSYGNTAERIGDWVHEATWTDRADVSAERAVALLRRRYRLGILRESERGFGAALAADANDLTAAKVYADWLDERGRGIEANYFRTYEGMS